jgi:methionyl-tRNA formyltransferase
MRLAFFGTPAFAVPSLRALLEEGFDVAAVVTQPDRPRGRSRSQSIPSPVKVAALEEELPLLQPERPVGAFAEELRAFDPELGVVVAYGHILKPEILAIPRLGLLNVHASLLPRLRGAAPIPWAILNGEETTGVSIMQMEAGLDSGPVLHQIETEVAADETGGELAVRLAELGAEALIEVLTLLQANAVNPRPQDHARATWAPKIDHALARIDWTRDGASLARVVRAFDPEPGAWAQLGDQEVKLYGGRTMNESGAPGTVLALDDALVVAAGIGALSVSEVQPAGRRRMGVREWSRGRDLAPGARFT